VSNVLSYVSQVQGFLAIVKLEQVSYGAFEIEFRSSFAEVLETATQVAIWIQSDTPAPEQASMLLTESSSQLLHTLRVATDIFHLICNCDVLTVLDAVMTKLKTQ
jgi:hypothetical protein